MKDSDAPAGDLDGGDITSGEVIGAGEATGQMALGGVTAPVDTWDVLKRAKPIFREVQRLQEFRVWLPLALVLLGVWYEFLQRFVYEGPGVIHRVPNWVVAILTAVIAGGALAFGLLAMRLVTEVHPGVLTVRVTPFPRAKLPMQAIKMAVVGQYSALKEYRGYGVKTNRRNGKAYIARGDQGVQMVLANGRLLLSGSQQPNELMTALRSAGAEFEGGSRKGRKQSRRAGAEAKRSEP